MPYPHTAQAIPLDIPIMGLNKRSPLSQMNQMYTAWMLNFETETQFLKARGGWQIHATLTDSSFIRALGVHDDDELFAYSVESSGFNKIYNVSSAGTQAAAAASHTTDGTGNVVRLSTHHYAGRLAFTINEAGTINHSRVYDGSTWTPINFDVGGTDTSGYVMQSYKGRVYIADDQKLIYGGLEAIQGACTEVDYSSYFEDSSDIIWMNTLTSPGLRADETFLAFGNEAGEILVYGGDYPDAANWEQVARFKVSRPAYWNADIQYRNDIWLMTEGGLVSIRKLFEGGSEGNKDLTVSDAIDPYITNLFAQYTVGAFSSNSSIVYQPSTSKIHFCATGHIDKDDVFSAPGASETLFTYNVITGAWTISKVPISSGNTWRSLVVYKNDLYVACENFVLKYNPTSYKDEKLSSPGSYEAYDLQLNSAYTNLNSNLRSKKVEGFDFLINTDFTSTEIGCRASADFGRSQSGKSNIILQSGRSNPFYSVGVDGNYLQYQLDGTSKTDSTTGFELYSAGVVVT